MKTDFDWNDFAFASKKPLRELRATFIAAPRQLSKKRFAQLVKRYLPQGNIILGIPKEAFVLGFDNQPQFTMLQLEDVAEVIAKVNESPSPHKIYTLGYYQREQVHLFEKELFKRAVFVNGSWKLMFHTSPTFYALAKLGLPYERVSPFADEAEALDYEARADAEIAKSTARPQGILTATEMLAVAMTASKGSYDHTYQTGVVLGKRAGDGYRLLATAFNKVVPYQTYAWLTGPSREENFSPPGDLNYYDAVHAEVMLILQAATRGIDLKDTTLFINLLPCPSCARMFTQTYIAEIVYTEDHSAGYAVQILEKAGKKVTRLVPENIVEEG